MRGARAGQRLHLERPLHRRRLGNAARRDQHVAGRPEHRERQRHPLRGRLGRSFDRGDPAAVGESRRGVVGEQRGDVAVGPEAEDDGVKDGEVASAAAPFPFPPPPRQHGGGEAPEGPLELGRRACRSPGGLGEGDDDGSLGEDGRERRPRGPEVGVGAVGGDEALVGHHHRPFGKVGFLSSEPLGQQVEHGPPRNREGEVAPRRDGGRGSLEQGSGERRRERAGRAVDRGGDVGGEVVRIPRGCLGFLGRDLVLELVRGDVDAGAWVGCFGSVVWKGGRSGRGVGEKKREREGRGGEKKGSAAAAAAVVVGAAMAKKERKNGTNLSTR